MAIYFHTEEVTFNFNNERIVSDVIQNMIINENKELSIGDINFIFCSDDYLLNINKQYLEHDFYTDVITFDYSSNTNISGDIYISIDRVGENADNLEILFNDELNRIIIHGVLHLLGYKDKMPSAKLIMTSKENQYLNYFAI